MPVENLRILNLLQHSGASLGLYRVSFTFAVDYSDQYQVLSAVIDGFREFQWSSA
jgi:hypothetical protein